MAATKHDTSLGKGVYFAPGDYIGITRRMIILVVDLIVFALVYAVLGAWDMQINDRELTDSIIMGYLVFIWAYLTILKASPLRTVGYWVTGARILNLRGERPSFLRMTFRLLLWLFGPFNLIFDLFWAGTDEDRQTLRDRFAGTCVVKNLAKPIGTGEIHFLHYHALGFNLMYPHVVRPVSSSPSVAAESPDAA